MSEKRDVKDKVVDYTGNSIKATKYRKKVQISTKNRLEMKADGLLQSQLAYKQRELILETVEKC